MRGTGLDVDLGRRAPDHHEPIDEVLAPEAVDVGPDGLEHRPLGHPTFDVGTVEALDVRRVERGGHRAHRAQRGADRLEVPAGVENASVRGGHIGVVGEDVPRAEHEIIELRQRHEVADERHPVLGAGAKPDRAQLRERADWLAHPAARELDAGDERARHRAEPDAEDAQLALGRGDGGRFGGGHGDVRRPGLRRASPRLPLPRVDSAGHRRSEREPTGDSRRAPAGLAQEAGGRLLATSCRAAIRCSRGGWVSAD